MLKVVGGDKLIDSLRKYHDEAQVSPRMEVGYAAPYAVHVHEDLTMSHRVGQAKFLEQPLKLYKEKIKELIRIGVRQRNMRDGLRQAGEFLKKESQKLVPVDTGILKASAYVKVVG